MTYCEIIANYFDSPGWVFTFAFIAILSLLLLLIKWRQYNLLFPRHEDCSPPSEPVQRVIRLHCPVCGDTVSSLDWDVTTGQCDTCCHAVETAYWAERDRLREAAEKDKELDILASKIAEKINSLNSGV